MELRTFTSEVQMACDSDFDQVFRFNYTKVPFITLDTKKIVEFSHSFRKGSQFCSLLKRHRDYPKRISLHMGDEHDLPHIRQYRDRLVQVLGGLGGGSGGIDFRAHFPTLYSFICNEKFPIFRNKILLDFEDGERLMDDDVLDACKFIMKNLIVLGTNYDNLKMSTAVVHESVRLVYDADVHKHFIEFDAEVRLRDKICGAPNMSIYGNIFKIPVETRKFFGVLLDVARHPDALIFDGKNEIVMLQKCRKAIVEKMVVDSIVEGCAMNVLNVGAFLGEYPANNSQRESLAVLAGCISYNLYSDRVSSLDRNKSLDLMLGCPIAEKGFVDAVRGIKDFAEKLSAAMDEMKCVYVEMLAESKDGQIHPKDFIKNAILNNIRMDPISFVEHKNKFVSTYAKMLISGD